MKFKKNSLLRITIILIIKRLEKYYGQFFKNIDSIFFTRLQKKKYNSIIKKLSRPLFIWKL